MADSQAIILKATAADAREILALQKLVFREEAELYDDWEIPPLTQTLEDLQREMQEQVFLKALLGTQIIGAVRARLEEITCHIGRLMVHPEWQRCGIGTRLMKEIEARFPVVRRFEVFTGSRSEGNIRLYRRLGYEPFVSLATSPKLTLVYLQKRQQVAPDPPA